MIYNFLEYFNNLDYDSKCEIIYFILGEEVEIEFIGDINNYHGKCESIEISYKKYDRLPFQGSSELELYDEHYFIIDEIIELNHISDYAELFKYLRKRKIKKLKKLINKQK